MIAQDLVRDSFYCDGHADTFRTLTLEGGRFDVEENGCHLSLPRLLQAHQNLQIMAIYTTYEERGAASTVTALRVIEYALAQIEQSGCGLIRNKTDLTHCREQKTPWVLLSLEGADPLMGSLEVLRAFFRSGLRGIGLTHNHNSVAAGGCAPPDGQRTGLTPFGRDLLPEMSRLGMLIDTAHLGQQALDEALALVTGPIINSHSCCRKFVDLERNLDDEQLRAIAATGGLSAVTYVPKFLVAEGEAGVADVFRHLEHMVEVAGIDHVGLGSDFDGVDVLPNGLKSPLHTPALVQMMIDAGWNSAQIAQVLGGNWLRVLGHVMPV